MHCILYNVLYVRITIIIHSIVFKTRFSHLTQSAYPETPVVVLSENTNIYIIIPKHGTHVCRIFADFRYIMSSRSRSLFYRNTWLQWYIYLSYTYACISSSKQICTQSYTYKYSIKSKYQTRSSLLSCSRLAQRPDVIKIRTRNGW